MKKKLITLCFLSMFLLLILTGCVPGDGTNNHDNLAGFFWGIWHGWIAPISLIISWFDKNVSIYEVMNRGFSYDFGFYIAIISGFGGLSLSRRKKNKD